MKGLSRTILLSLLLILIPTSVIAAGVGKWEIGDPLPEENCETLTEELDGKEIEFEGSKECDLGKIDLMGMEFELKLRGTDEISSILLSHDDFKEESGRKFVDCHTSKAKHGAVAEAFWEGFLTAMNGFSKGSSNFVNEGDFNNSTPEKERYVGRGSLSEDDIDYSIFWNDCLITIRIADSEWYVII